MHQLPGDQLYNVRHVSPLEFPLVHHFFSLVPRSVKEHRPSFRPSVCLTALPRSPEKSHGAWTLLLRRHWFEMNSAGWSERWNNGVSQSEFGSDNRVGVANGHHFREPVQAVQTHTQLAWWWPDGGRMLGWWGGGGLSGGGVCCFHLSESHSSDFSHLEKTKRRCPPQAPQMKKTCLPHSSAAPAIKQRP